jgi:uncharacterized damage-inducible protein DinB
MTYYGGRELAASFRTVRRNTLQMAEEIPEASYDFKPSDHSRTIRQTLAHIAMVTAFQTHVHQNRLTTIANINFPELLGRFGAEESRSRTKAELIDFLSTEGEKFATYLEGLSDGFLGEPVGMPPGAQPAAKSRFEMLMSAKEHEMHHRGQLMVMQRMIGHTPHLTRQAQERMAAARAAAAPAATAGR